MNLSRRKFLSSLAAAGAAVSLGYNGMRRPGEPEGTKHRIHIFSKPLTWLGYEETAILLAEAGAEGIDLTVRPGGHVLPENVIRDLPIAYKAARRNGLEMEMIVTDILRADQPYAEQIIKTAASLGIKYYRLGWASYDEKSGITDSLKKVAADLKNLQDLNKSYGIHGAYQNHAGTMIGGAVWDLYEMIRDLDPEYIGCQYDIRHAVAEASGSWPVNLKLIAPWIRCTDIKDFKWIKSENGWNPVSVPLGEGMVRFDEYFDLVKKLNIPGPVSLHLEYPPFENGKPGLSPAMKKDLFRGEMKKDIEKLKAFRAKYLV